MPDSTLSLALQEAYASAPTGVRICHTLELRHPAFVSPIRVVRDTVNLSATLEATAPANAGEVVDFVAYAFDVVRPEVSPAGVPQCTITIDNVAREILAAIEASLTTTDPIEITYREFLSTDLSGPQNDPPITMVLGNIDADVFRITATASFRNIGNRRFPSLEYDADTFPGLLA